MRKNAEGSGCQVRHGSRVCQSPLMKILSAHFLKEFYTTFFFCLLTLLFVFLVTQGFIQLADLLFNKEIDLFLLLNLLGLTLPFLLTFIIPTSVLVASLLTFGRLSHD